MTQTTQPSPRQIEHELTELHDKIVALQTKKRPAKEKELLAEAKTALEQKDLKALQSVLEKLHRFRQRNGGTPKALAETLILKAHAAFAADAVPKALALALNAVELVPNDASHHNDCAYYMAQLKQYEEAKKYAHIVLELTKRNRKPSQIRMQAMRRLGYLALHDNNHKESAEYYKKYLRLKTQCGLAPNYRDYSDVGYAYEKAEMYPEAAFYYEKTVRAFKETTAIDDLNEISAYYAGLRRMWAHTKTTNHYLCFARTEYTKITEQNRSPDDPYANIIRKHYEKTLELAAGTARRRGHKKGARTMYEELLALEKTKAHPSKETLSYLQEQIDDPIIQRQDELLGKARIERQKGNTKKALALYENLLSLEEAKNCPEERMLFFLRAQIQYLRKSKILQAIARKNPTKHHNRTLSRWAYLDGKHCIPIVRVSFS
ncbi:MAG: hypothetical protein ACK59C_06175 [Holosporales bacterium]